MVTNRFTRDSSCNKGRNRKGHRTIEKVLHRKRGHKGDYRAVILINTEEHVYMV